MFVIRFLDAIGLSLFWGLNSFLIGYQFWSGSFCYICIKCVSLCIAFSRAHVKIPSYGLSNLLYIN
jgi:hypothetical protein